jgi:hypothetical protein
MEDGRMKLITLEVEITGAVMAIALPPDPFVMTGAVIAIASLFWFAGVPNTLCGRREVVVCVSHIELQGCGKWRRIYYNHDVLFIC